MIGSAIVIALALASNVVETPKAPPPSGAPLVSTSVQDFSAFVDAVKTKIVHLEIQDRNGTKVGNGTGFVVRKDGVVVTNEHVAAVGPKIIAVFDNKERIEVTGAWVRDAAHDIAVLQLAKREAPYPSLALGTSASIRTGTPIAVVGSPLGFNHSLSNGVISAIRPKGLGDGDDAAEQQRLLQITAPVSPGSSGSPVMLLDGTVVGVATLALSGRAQALNFAVPVEVVSAHLAPLGPSTQATALDDGIQKTPAPLSTVPWMNLLISVVVLLGVFGLWLLLSRRERR